jgi:hypothetical protein
VDAVDPAGAGNPVDLAAAAAPGPEVQAPAGPSAREAVRSDPAVAAESVRVVAAPRRRSASPALVADARTNSDVIVN